MTDALGQVGFAETDIRTESVPTSGQLEISPREGRPLSTVFTLRTFGWTDELGDDPYLYRLGFWYLCSPQGSRMCEEWLTGITEDNYFTFLLPDIDLALVPEVLLRVSDRNGAVQYSTQPFDSAILSPRFPSEGTGVSHLMSLMADVRTLVAGGNWVQGLAHLASLLSSIDLDHEEIICNESQILLSPKLQLTNGDFVSLKMAALPILVEVFYNFIPCSQTHHQIILSLMQKATRTRCRIRMVEGVRLIESDVQGLLGLLERAVGKANQFSDAGIISRRGFSVEDVKTILCIFEQIIFTPDASMDPLLRMCNNITTKLSLLLPDISYGLCTRQNINEESSSIDVDGFVNIKSSLLNLPPDYITGSCRDVGCNFEPVRINFGAGLHSMFLQWDCAGSRSCSGVCLTSSLFHTDILWRGNVFSPLLKTPLLQLSLQNPSNGSPLDVQLPTAAGPLLTFPIVAPYSSASNLACVVWDTLSLQWASGGCTTEVEQSRVFCRCSDVGALYYAVLERCPSGYYGQTCSLSESVILVSGNLSLPEFHQKRFHCPTVWHSLPNPWGLLPHTLHFTFQKRN